MPPFTPTYYPPSNSQVASNASKPHPAYWSAKPAVATSSPSLSIAKTSKVIKSNDPNESQVVSGVPNASAGPYLSGPCFPTHGPSPCDGDDGDLPSNFDWRCAPGADQWSISQTSDGRAVYSTKDGVAPSVVVEFLKCDW